MPARTCEICNERTALYLCQNCGSSICPVCRVGWFCKKCTTTEPSTTSDLPEPLKVGPVPLPLAAIAIIIAGFILVFLGLTAGTSSSGCFFWPFPLIVSCGLGSGGALIPVAFFLVFLAAMIAFWLLSIRWSRMP